MTIVVWPGGLTAQIALVAIALPAESRATVVSEKGSELLERLYPQGLLIELFELNGRSPLYIVG